MNEVLTLTGLKKALDNGTAQELFPVGTRIDDTWTDIGAVKTYPAPLIVADYREFNTLDEDENIKKRLGAVLIREDTLPGKWAFNDYRDRLLTYEDSSAASALANKYADGCSDELSRLATKFMLTENGIVVMPVTHFLPSVEELAIMTNPDRAYGPDDAWAAWELFRETPTVAGRDDCQKLACSSPYYTRTTIRSGCYEGSAWAVGHCGDPSKQDPRLTISFRPACIIA